MAERVPYLGYRRQSLEAATHDSRAAAPPPAPPARAARAPGTPAAPGAPGAGAGATATAVAGTDTRRVARRLAWRFDDRGRMGTRLAVTFSDRLRYAVGSRRSAAHQILSDTE